MTTCVAEAKVCWAWEATLDMAQHSQGRDGMDAAVWKHRTTGVRTKQDESIYVTGCTYISAHKSPVRK